MGENRRNMLAKVGSSWEALQEALDLVPPDRQTEAGVVEAWSVKDLLGHVTSWERQAMKTVRSFQETGELSVLDWSDVDGFNAETAEANKARTLEDLKSDMDTVHDELLGFIEGLPTKIVDEPQVQRRIRVDGYEHYAEHTEHILKWLSNTSAR